jgi:hypothetical protein
MAHFSGRFSASSTLNQEWARPQHAGRQAEAQEVAHLQKDIEGDREEATNELEHLICSEATS